MLVPTTCRGKSLAKLQLFLEIRKRMKKKLNNKVMDDYHQ